MIKGITWFIGGFILVLIVSLITKFVMLPIIVAHQAVNSAQGVVQKTLDPRNVITSYEWFWDADGQYQSRVKQIVASKSLLAGAEDKDERARLRMELAAQQQSCRDLVTRYNANSEKTNKSIFKGREAPQTLLIGLCE